MANVPPQVADGKCHAKNKTTGEPCKRPPLKGGVVCYTHGGTLPNVKNAATFRLTKDKAQKEALARLKAEKVGRVGIVTEMDRLAAEVIVFKDVCRERLDELLSLPDGIRYKGQTGEQLRAEVALYERALDRCNVVLATNVKLGIQEKRAELEKQKAILVATIFREVINELQLSRDKAAEATRLFSQKMLAISAEVSE